MSILIKEILKTLIMALLTNSMLKHMVIAGLKKLAKQTDNELDDQLVAAVEAALSPQE